MIYSATLEKVSNLLILLGLVGMIVTSGVLFALADRMPLFAIFGSVFIVGVAGNQISVKAARVSIREYLGMIALVFFVFALLWASLRYPVLIVTAVLLAAFVVSWRRTTHIR